MQGTLGAALPGERAVMERRELEHEMKGNVCVCLDLHGPVCVIRGRLRKCG